MPPKDIKSHRNAHLTTVGVMLLSLLQTSSCTKSSRNTSFLARRKNPTREGLGLMKRSNLLGQKETELQYFLNTIRGGDGKQVEEDNGPGASISASVFNLVNNVAGAGILTLAAGKAKGTGWIPSVLICCTLGLISCHTFKLIGEACGLMGERDFKGLWAKTIGTETTYMIDMMIAFMCLACSVIYSGILGDVWTPILSAAGLPDSLNFRSTNILFISLFVLFPLSLIKNLSGLAFTSTLGFLAIAYTVVFILFRALDGSYSLSPPGKFILDGIITAPSFLQSSWDNIDFSSLVLASNLGLAYIAHYNAPVFYREMKNPKQNYPKMVSISFVILTTLYIATMCAGYATFGDITKGNILLNYHPEDILSTLAKVATGFSILFGYPLVVCGAREGILGAANALGHKSWSEDKNHLWVVMAILTIVTSIAIVVQDVSLVVGLTGAALGSFIVYILPGIIYTRCVGIVKGKEGKEYGVAKLNLALVPFGICIAGLGCFMTLKEAGLVA